MKRVGIILLSLCFILPSITVNAQQKKRMSTLEFGLFLGASNYIGELTKGTVPPLNRTGLAIGMLARFDLNPYWSLKGNAIYGRIAGDDKDYEDDAFRSLRNLSFRSNILDVSVQAEWNILGYETTPTSNAFSPYLFAGLSVFKFNPKAQYKYIPGLHDAYDPALAAQDGDWVELQPLGTEGQESKQYNDRKFYSLTQIAIPIGFGVKAQLDRHWAIGLEMGFRKTFTDYIDDISKDYVNYQIVTGNNGHMANIMRDRSFEVVADPASHPGFLPGEARGDDSSKDWYILTGLTITYRIFSAKDKCFQF